LFSTVLRRARIFAIETTLRSDITFEQANSARAAGFATEMRYLAVKDFAMHLERVKTGDAGGDSASEATLRRIYRSIVAHLSRAVAEIDQVWAYDNSTIGGPPRLLMETENAAIRFLVEDPPDWVVQGADLPHDHRWLDGKAI
jgi:predicted ABC-type ATPase